MTASDQGLPDPAQVLVQGWLWESGSQRKMAEPEPGRRGPQSIHCLPGQRISEIDALKAGIKVKTTNQMSNLVSLQFGLNTIVSLA